MNEGVGLLYLVVKGQITSRPAVRCIRVNAPIGAGRRISADVDGWEVGWAVSNQQSRPVRWRAKERSLRTPPAPYNWWDSTLQKIGTDEAKRRDVILACAQSAPVDFVLADVLEMGELPFWLSTAKLSSAGRMAGEIRLAIPNLSESPYVIAEIAADRRYRHEQRDELREMTGHEPTGYSSADSPFGLAKAMKPVSGMYMPFRVLGEECDLYGVAHLQQGAGPGTFRTVFHLSDMQHRYLLQPGVGLQQRGEWWDGSAWQEVVRDVAVVVQTRAPSSGG